MTDRERIHALAKALNTLLREVNDCTFIHDGKRRNSYKEHVDLNNLQRAVEQAEDALAKAKP